MNWTEVTIITTPEAVEAVSGILYETGVGGVSVEDPTLLLEENRTTKEWDVLDKEVEDRYSMDRAVIKAYYAPGSNMEDILLLIREGINRASEYINTGDFKITASVVNEQDWENNWKQYYKPVKVGKRIIIKPLWEDINDTDRDVVIELDPGMAFGTGTHETTRMCLALLEETITENSHVLDIGTGSGILSIGAAKLGAGKITAVDIDSVAVKVAKENAEINKINDKIEILCGNLTDCINGKYDIVVANIIADAIIQLSSGVRPFLKENGIYITSGIINHRLDDVKEALIKNGFEIVKILTEGDWAAVVCK